MGPARPGPGGWLACRADSGEGGQAREKPLAPASHEGGGSSSGSATCSLCKAGTERERERKRKQEPEPEPEPGTPPPPPRNAAALRPPGRGRGTRGRGRGRGGQVLCRHSRWGWENESPARPPLHHGGAGLHWGGPVDGGPPGRLLHRHRPEKAVAGPTPSGLLQARAREAGAPGARPLQDGGSFPSRPPAPVARPPRLRKEGGGRRVRAPPHLGPGPGRGSSGAAHRRRASRGRLTRAAAAAIL